MLPQTTPRAIPAAHAPIYRLEAELLKLPQVEMPVEHDFVPGLYARTMRLKADHVYTGAEHKGACFFVVRSGMLISTLPDGSLRQLESGDMHAVPSGSKRAVVALTDCVVTTFHPNHTDERDPVALWDLFTVPAPALGLGQAAALEVAP